HRGPPRAVDGEVGGTDPARGQADDLRNPIEGGEEGETTHDWRPHDDEVIARCALTRQPIHDDDDVITDEDTGDVILRDVLPWPDAPAADAEAA
ncbi:hypothetical protein EBR96_08885, partial [bacterium]|nr:hypothetical protein [bacterium]